MSFNDPSSFDDQRKRFESEAQSLGKSPGYRYYCQLRAYCIERSRAPDQETRDRLTRLIDQIRSEGLTRSTGPPAAIADRQLRPPTSTE